MEKGFNEKKRIQWHKNAHVMVGSYSIFAALAGVFLSAVILDPALKAHWVLPATLFSTSVVAFIWGVEKLNDALDENDVDKYLSWLLVYNVGVVTLFFGVASFVVYHFGLNVYSTQIIIFCATFLCSSKWFKDVFELLGDNEAKYEGYRSELLGERNPEPEPDCLMKFHQCIRKIINVFRCSKTAKDELPSEGVYTRLAQSEIHGIGVHAIRDIKKDTNVFPNDDSRLVWIDEEKLSKLNLSDEMKKLYDDFCVIKNGKYGCPQNFNNLTVSWYLNESEKGTEPNMYGDENYDFFASRDIKKGEELTVDYSTYSEPSAP